MLRHYRLKRISGDDTEGMNGLAVRTEDKRSFFAGIKDHEQEITHLRHCGVRDKDREMIRFVVLYTVGEEYCSIGIEDSNVVQEFQPTLPKRVRNQLKSGRLLGMRGVRLFMRTRDTERKGYERQESAHGQSESAKSSRYFWSISSNVLSSALSISRTAKTCPSLKKGTTISLFERLEQAMCPGNRCTSGTTRVDCFAQAVPQTPLL